ncbi:MULTISPECIES: SPFH domain-containing protein [unclassified Corynebacterium]|uniref:SPFH domain-containing protein n=1 Tax=unclassified Corynebacterium TaxID=2624378 RepID=UPI0029C9B8A3|nr:MULTISPECIES: SPFH domain-containing protein [unclassified Corynebacterium]WPF65912.1 SPFH domain-containing protein [Corynebacterium sp. 22KM0430]WPF68405.1 SPFH domain-containing protein [Corynebacterium sp. 21KM1197]
MFLFIVSIVLIAAGILAFFISPNQKKPEDSARHGSSPTLTKRSMRIIGGSTIAVAVIILILTCVTVVQPRTVGIKTAFGKPTGSLGNGLHIKAPWESVTKLDGAKQNDIYRDGGENTLGSIEVRLGNDAKATVDASLQWQLKVDRAEELFMDYRTFEGIQSNLVDRNFRAALNEVMSGYDPLSPANVDADHDTLAVLSQQTLERMRAKVNGQIEVHSVTIPIINFDEATQARIDELQSEIARTRIAEQKKATNEAEARANQALEGSLTPEVLTSKCLDIVAEHGQSPLGCFPTDVQPVVGAQ